MTRMISYARIAEAVSAMDLRQVIDLIEEGFVAYSRNRVTVPPVGEMLFSDPPGEVHIKSGAIEGDRIIVIKVAAGFYHNRRRGLPVNSGLMLVLDRLTGHPLVVLDDRGLLTAVRTAAAGAVAARHLAPADVRCIGILGTGDQARWQLRLLQAVTACRNVMAWGRDQRRVAALAAEMQAAGYRVRPAATAAEVAAACQLIVTATAATAPLLTAPPPGPAHITAVGSDTPEKIELAPAVLAAADVVVADSLAQSAQRGEIHHARRAGALDGKQVVELGQVIQQPERGRTAADQLTVADLTGVAVQDIQICKAVGRALELDWARPA